MQLSTYIYVGNRRFAPDERPEDIVPAKDTYSNKEVLAQSFYAVDY